MAESIGTAVGTKVVENLVDRILNFILNPITVVRKCNENVENLKNQVEALENIKRSVERYIEDVGRRGEEMGKEVQTWLTKADQFIKAAEESVRVGEDIAKKECFFGLCPNPIPRYKLIKEAEKNSQDIVQHLEVARGFGPLPFSHAPLPQQNVVSVSYPPTQEDVAAIVEGFEEFPSRMAVLKQIMEALRNPIVNTIGVYGTSGVGKTMLLKMVKGKAKQDNLFTQVVMATVTKDRDLKSIQEDIARDLGLDQLSFTELTHRQVADRIKDKLINVKKFLVILDDVWETEIDLEKVRIPSVSELKQAMEKKNEESSSGLQKKAHLEKKNEESSSGQHKKAHLEKKNEDMFRKILLTSRYQDVLSGIMDEKDQVFEVHKLEDDESWHLFKKIVGSHVESSNLLPIAKEIVEKCLGLPVAIASVGKAMKGKTQPFEWEDALLKMKKPSPKGISAAVYKPIELNYNNLEDEELKQIFILCSLLGHDSSVDYLLKYGMGLDLFQMVNTIEETRTRVQTLVSHLKRSSLLVDGHSSLHFNMHDQIREVALSIAYRDHGGLALVDEVARKKLKDKVTLEKLKWISFPNGDIELPANGLQCPQLTFFYLSNKARSQEVPLEFFKRADGLKVLCLTKIDFESIPSPIPLIPFSTNLHSLILDQCVFKVGDLGAIMGNLENLEVLSLSGCDIEELPREIEGLIKLKLLDVSDCTKLKVIPRQVLARLSKLEELKMGNSFERWDDVEEGNARLTELSELHKLTALEVRVPNLQETFFPENLKRFKIFIGIVMRKDPGVIYVGEKHSWDSYSWNSSLESSKIMKLKLQGASITSNHSIRKLLKKTEELYLEGLNGVENLVYELNDEGFQHLKCLQVQKAPDIRNIFNSSGRLVPSNVFPILEALTLSNLAKMEKICDGLTGAAPFKELRKITIFRCHQLKNLFSFSIARQLQRLQEISVEYCNNIEQIIDGVKEQGNENDVVEESERCKLGSLWSLKLEYLPKLLSFNSNCGGISSLFNDKVVFLNLEVLQLFEINTNQLWIISSGIENPQKMLDFKKLKHLQIFNCNNLEYLFTHSMISGLVQLKDLYVSSCQDLKQVIMVKGVEEIVNKELIFPQLNSISLRHCDKLSSFYAGSSTLKFQSAIKITIHKCQNMITFTSTVSTEQEKEIACRGTKGCLGKKEQNIPSWTLFYDAVDIPLLDNLDLDSICVQQIWHSQVTSMSSFVQNLRKLIMWNCNNLKYLFTSSMVKSFEQLQVLDIRACNEMEVVILTEELLEKEKMSQIMFPKLDTLELYDLNQLIRFCSNCNSLGEVYEPCGLNGNGSQVLATTQSILVETEVTQLVLPQVTYLELNYLPKFKGFFPGIHITKWPLLKRMHVVQCHKVKTFASKYPSNENTYGDNGCGRQTQYPMFWISKDSFPCLEELKFVYNESMKEIWHGQYPRVYFPKLKDIVIFNFPKLSAFPHFFFQTLPSLEKLVMSKASFHEIFQCEKLSSEERLADAPSQLSQLKLSTLNELMHIWKVESNLKPIFYTLRTLEVLECIKLVNLVPSIVSFKNLQTLEVSRCHGLKNLVSYSTAKTLVQLKRMSITNCDLVEEVVWCLEDDVMDGIVFSQLKYLQLHDLPRLTSFCTRKCDFEFPSLKEVIVMACPQMKYFSMGKTVAKELQNVQWINNEKKGHWAGDLNSTIYDLFTQKVGYCELVNLKLSKSFELIEIWNKNHEETLSFKMLEYLEVCNCNSLSYLLTPSMALGLVQLQDLKIKDCVAMEQVIMVTRVDELIDTRLILFPQLKSISLESCSKLSSFSVGSNTLKFPMLEEIFVKDCLRMVKFTSKFSSEQKKEMIDGRSGETLVKIEPNIFTEAFFCDEVKISVLQKLTMSSINVKQIWSNQLSSISSFAQHLTNLKVVNCCNLKYLLTFSMVKNFAQLEELVVSGCEMMEMVILIEGMVEEEKICQTVFPKLKTLVLNDVSQLVTFCSNYNSMGEMSDSKGDNIDSGSQEHLATLSTLVEMKTTKLVFSQLTELVLRLLPKFKNFFPQMHITEWPSLKSLFVFECHGVQIFASKFSNIKMTQGDNQLERETQHLMFWISKATFPSLEWLVVKWNYNMKIWCGHHPEEYFGKLELLMLIGFPKQSAFLPPFFFQSLPNLEMLVVKDAFFSEIFQCDEVTAEEKPACELTPLIYLTLSKLDELTHLWKEESQLEINILNNLTTLKVQECSRLKNLVPSTVHFDNLQTLVISECHGLVNLVRYSTAKSLAQLERMKVVNCEMIEEIIVCLGDAVKDSIVFTKLECLQLKGLSRLESFCSGTCNFKFPVLEEVIIIECTNMQTFSKGELSTPELHGVKLTGDIGEDLDEEIDVDIEKYIVDFFHKDEDEDGVEDDAVEDERSWEGNLNSTIQQLFKEKSARNCKEGQWRKQ